MKKVWFTLIRYFQFSSGPHGIILQDCVLRHGAHSVSDLYLSAQIWICQQCYYIWQMVTFHLRQMSSFMYVGRNGKDFISMWEEASFQDNIYHNLLKLNMLIRVLILGLSVGKHPSVTDGQQLDLIDQPHHLSSSQTNTVHPICCSRSWFLSLEDAKTKLPPRQTLQFVQFVVFLPFSLLLPILIVGFLVFCISLSNINTSYFKSEIMCVLEFS